MLYLLFLAVLMPAYAFGAEPMLELRNGGVSLGKVYSLDCTGAGLTCSTSIGIGSLISAAGSPADATYWVGSANGTLSAEHNLGALSTGLVLNTAGTPSAYAGTTCTNQVLRLLSASGAGTCITITSAYVDTSVWTGTASSGLLKASSQGVLTAATGGVDYANASHAHVDADIPNTITLDNLTQVTTRAISDTSGTLLVPRGGSGLTAVAANQLYVGTGVDTFTAKTLPSCSNGTNDKLLYNNSTNEFSCGTDGGGGGGGLSHDQTMTRIAYGF